MTAGSLIETEIETLNHEGARNITIGDQRNRLTTTDQATTKKNDPGMIIDVTKIRIAIATTITAISEIEEVSPHVANDAMIYMNDMPVMMMMMSRVLNTR
jgi:hypothetical protein